MVELEGISKRFGRFTAVDEVSLEIRAGEFLTLLGPSGCGKTTLLRMISGFETPDAGRIMLAGQDVTGVPPYRRDVNQVFQSYALFPHLSVAENISFGLKMRRLGRAEIRKKVAAAVELVALTGLEDRSPSQLSGGQRQRVALARALVCEPKVLLLDEPLAALDAKLRRAMQVELKRLQTRVGITFVFVTHDQEEALTMSDRIAVMNGGKIEQLGAAADVYENPRTAFVAGFLGQANLLAGHVVRCDGQTVWVAVGSGEILPAAGKRSVGADVVLSIRPERIVIASHPADGASGIHATLVERIFKGAFQQLLFRTESGDEIVVTAGNSSVVAKLSAPVFLQMDRADLRLLKR